MSGPELYSTVRREGGRAETPRGALHSLSVLGVSDGDCRSSVRGVARAKLRYEYIYIEREHGSRAPHTPILALSLHIRSKAPDTRGTVNEYDRIYLELARVWRGYLVFCALGGC